MPSPSKRARRPRRESLNEVDIPDSSPSRPAKRRKKTEEIKTDLPISNQLSPEESAPTMDDKEAIISRVTQHLGLPGLVQVSQDHADEKHTIESRGGISAFAKLAGKGWAYYIKDLNNVVGRNPADGQDEGPVFDVHIDLGPSKMISRQHASIHFNDGWRIRVIGRNGVKVDYTTFRRGETTELHSGAIIDISGVEMMFVLPEGSLKIDSRVLQRTELVADVDTDDARKHKDSTPDVLPPPPSTNGIRGQNGAPQPIAPAPPNYQRPGTPAASRIRIPGSTKRSPPGYSAGGTMVMNDAENVDLSDDANCHIKPGYSYGQMIAQAIISTPGETLALNGIYQYIMAKYAYYRHQPPNGWQNSIRHNLSLSKSYEKTPREKHEPGKGMKWVIKTECYEATKALAYQPAGRGGHRGSSQPGSPITTAGRGIKDEFNPGSVIKEKRSPSSASPRLNSYRSRAPQFTPDRAPRIQILQEDFPDDGSPLPRHRRAQNGTLGLSDNIPGSPTIVSSSYQQDEGTTFVTPAPHRVHPHLAPPSTAQRPSQHMPTSSPAPFWKFVGITPLRAFGGYDTSPIKGYKSSVLPSSSPPPMRRGSAMSPTRNGPPEKLQILNIGFEMEEEAGFDLARGFQSIGSYHAPIANSVAPGASESNLATQP
ncbi:putative Fork head protein like protein [Sclerotinia borealis F-4128]|uniref:Putative Fork head protein like protein n=1 Tax=Sclerotinia borealis (strain F-4128) TaxID=1432307 RepID=W9CLM9_SCLBF|nr:putative Fork head protein like protein [Sclerotinia borealis F-4128]